MKDYLADLLRVLVEVVQNHSTRIEALEREEIQDNGDDASLMQEVTSLLAKLQTPEPAEPVPSDQM